MRVIDASSIVLAWDIYPIDQFSKFWLWVESNLKAETLLMGQPNFDEVGHVSPDCHSWLASNLTVLPVDNEVMAAAVQINLALGVSGGNYHSSGVDENDVFCIAMGKAHNCGVISDEALQASLPVDPLKYKIPAVCAMPQVSVDCVSLNQYIRQSGASF